MAGVQIDGVNNKIDFDDDLDTSISANTDDTLVIEAGGNTMATITATTFTINDGTTITTADNNPQLTLTSTDTDANSGPRLDFIRNPGEAGADADFLSAVLHRGYNDATELTTFVEMNAQIVDASNGSEDGRFYINTMVAGTAATSRMELTPTETVFNEGSADLDFRVESNDATHQLFVDAGNNKVYMGSGSGNSIDNMHLQLQNQGLTVSSFAGDANSNEIHFIKSRNTTVGSSTVVSNGDQLGSIVFQGDDGTDYATPGASIRAIVDGNAGGNDMPGALILSTTADGASSVTERMRIHSSGNVGIGSNNALGKLHIETADSGGSAGANADELVVEGNDNSGLTILSGTSGSGNIHFGDSGDNDIGLIRYDHGDNAFLFNTNANSNFGLSVRSDNKITTNAETAPDCGVGGLTLNQGAFDDNILTFKSSDVNAGASVSGLEADTYVAYKKLSAGAGGLLTIVQSETIDCIETRALQAEATTNTDKNTGANAPIMFKSAETHSSGIRALSNSATNANLFIIADHTTRRFIFDSEGDLHSDSSNTTFDSYEDAHLVRAFDLSHGRGVINSKFDEFIKYQHEDLAKAGLVGREEDGSPNHFINMSGFQRLHNGAIWQQYEKHQRLAEAVYEMAKETLGADKADAILKKHDIKLLN